MKNFLKHIILYFLLLGIITGIYLVIIWLKPEWVDNFYRRFTTPRAPSMILGTSRPAQGIRPAIIAKELGYNGIVNHSFAIGPSSYGPNYLREISQKLDTTSRNGLFILSVDPWSLATGTENKSDDENLFYEVRNKLFVGNLRSSSTNPNLQYLEDYWSDRFLLFVNAFKSLIHYKKRIVLHENGWLEVYLPYDTVQCNRRIKQSTAEYAAKSQMVSNTRVQYLEKIISLLKNHGKVVLVRMPVSRPMARLEEKKFPEFGRIMEEVAQRNEVRYIDFFGLSGSFTTVDTHHLYRNETGRFTEMLCDSIRDTTRKRWASTP
ncbi:MAG: hypothetical protein Kow00127_01680 [Bacteroidales bacterium]